MNNDLISRSVHIDKFTAEAKKIAANDKDFAQALMYVVTCLDAAPAVDAVEVVRCRECEKRETIECVLSYFVCEDFDVDIRFLEVPDDFYCPYGERRKECDTK